MRALVLSVLLSGCVSYTVGPGHVLHPRRDAETGGLALDSAAVAEAVPGTTVESFPIQTPDGVALYGLRARHTAPDDARPTVLYFGGNGFRMSALGMKKLVPLLRTGADVVLVDHRGHGRSPGTATVDALKADALAVFDAVAAEVGAERVVVHGHSLGSFLASHVGAHRDAGGVVLENSATTTGAYVRSRYDFYPVFRPFVRLDVDPALADEGSLGPVREITEPLLILAGALDARIPARMSRELYAASPLAPGRKRLAVFETAGHNRVPFHRDFPRVYRSFLALVRAGASMSGPSGASHATN
ncbi:alpha/beta hydrolase family protein [Rubrivirga sp.]|uniref:alpha/beta hydrolase family protein n=1 Tax=Rubrivirga sp. TaxID=1885344 RepID=UPI003B520207